MRMAVDRNTTCWEMMLGSWSAEFIFTILQGFKIVLKKNPKQISYIMFVIIHAFSKQTYSNITYL